MRQRMHDPLHWPDAMEREDGVAMPVGRIIAEVKARAAGAPPVPASTAESPEEAEERLSRQRASREGVWVARLPRRYVGANLGALRPQQHPEALAEWIIGPPAVPPARTSGWLNLLLTGPSRRGKTYAVYALGNAHVAAGGYAVAWSLADLNAALRPDGDATAYDRAIGVDLLVLDDIGREQVSTWTLEQLQRILDHRNREGLRTAMTTNLTYAQLVERYTDPIVQRLLDDCTVLKVEGERVDGGETTW